MGCDEEIDEMLRINLYEARTNKEIFTFVAWIRAFYIDETIYSELCHEFYSTYEFDEVCADDELKTKKIIKFKLGGHAHSLNLLEFARRLGLYHAEELDEEGFDVRVDRSTGLKILSKVGIFFENELCHEFYSTYEFDEVCADDELKTKKIIKFKLGGHAHSLTLLEFARRLGLYHAEELDEEGHQNGYANVAWLIARWMKRKGAGTERESLICCWQFITKLSRKARVAILRAQRASMQDLYERMGSMEIHQGTIERMAYRQSYHWD
nr:hypothetical protein [Tanacetum cinerariifolium]